MKNINMWMVLASLCLVACGNDEKLVEKVHVQSQEAINVENQNLELWARRLNSDLVEQQKFIASIEGEYEGRILKEGELWRIKVRLIPTMPAYDHGRVRTLAELEYELQNQLLDAQIVHWDEALQISSVGCVFEDIRPDFKRGRLNIVGTSCPNTYQVVLEDGDGADRIFGADVSDLIRSDRLNQVETLQGRMQSNGNPESIPFTLVRVNQ